MRILLGLDTFGLIGGSERYALSLASVLAERGHAVGVLCAERRADAPREIHTLVHPVYSSRHAERGELEALERSVLEFAPDRLLVLTTQGRAALERLTGLGDRAPLSRFAQDHTLFCPGSNKLYADGSPCSTALGAHCLERYYRRGGCFGFRRELHGSALDGVGGLWKWLRAIELARRARTTFVASHYMQRELVAAGFDAARVVVAPYFTRSNSSAIAAREPDLATRDFVQRAREPLILCAARLALPDKGVDFLLSALGELRTPWRAVVAGTGPAEAWLRTKARDEGLGERVHFAGWQGANEMEWLYARATLVAFPSVWDEPFGLVGLEAMAHEKPVVAFDVGGVREWLDHERTGLAVPRRDTQAFARAVDRLLGDRELAARLGSAARARAAERFSVDAHLERLGLG